MYDTYLLFVLEELLLMFCASPVELNVGILCACLPLLSPLAGKIPVKSYFKNRYNSIIKLIRGSSRSWSISEYTELDVESGDAIHLMKSGHSGHNKPPKTTGRPSSQSEGEHKNDMATTGRDL